MDKIKACVSDVAGDRQHRDVAGIYVRPSAGLSCYLPTLAAEQEQVPHWCKTFAISSSKPSTRVAAPPQNDSWTN